MGFWFQERIIALGSFGTSKEVPNLMTKDAGIPVSMAALKKDPFRLGKALKHFLCALEELFPHRFMIVSIWAEFCDTSALEIFFQLSLTRMLHSSSSCSGLLLPVCC